jgi:hypothetical protein
VTFNVTSPWFDLLTTASLQQYWHHRKLPLTRQSFLDPPGVLLNLSRNHSAFEQSIAATLLISAARI